MIVVWRITEKCNLSCAFCGYDRRLARPRRDADPAQVIAFGRRLAAHQSQTGERVLVSWLGGEPLLWKPLEAITTQFVRDFGLHVSTTTNGTSLHHRSVRRHALADYRELTVSVDAIGRRHDALRGWPGGFERVRTAVRTLTRERALQGSTMRLRANCVLTRDTVAGFGGLARELASWGVDELTFNQLGGRERPEYYPDHRVLPDQMDRFIEQLPVVRADVARQGMQVAGGQDYLGRLRASAAGRGFTPSRCHPGDGFLFIDVDGRVGACGDTLEHALDIDDVGAFGRLPGRLASRLDGTSCGNCRNTRGYSKFATRAGSSQ